MRHHYIYILAAALGLATTSVEAQRADTLRRSLTVMTSEQIILGEKMPQATTFTLPKPYRAEAAATTPAPVANYADLLSIDPIAAAVPLPKFYERGEQLGYIDASVGLKYNGRFGAGIRPINTQRQLLQFALETKATSHEHQHYNRPNSIREWMLNLGIEHYYKAKRATVQTKAQYGLDRVNYYGLLPQPTLAPVPSATADKSNERTLHHASIGVDINSNQPSGDWIYRIAPSIGLAAAEGLLPTNAQHSTREWMPQLDLLVQSSTKGFGAKVSALAMLYSNSGSKLADGTPSYQSKSLLSFAPFWSTALSSSDQLNYSLNLGATLSTYTSGMETGRLQIAPDLTARLSSPRGWELALSVRGDVQPNSLRSMLSQMPYQYIGLDTRMTRRPLWFSVSGGGLILPNLSIDVYTDYQSLRDAVSYIPTAHAVRTSISVSAPKFLAIAYKPTYSDGSILSIGGNINYRHKGLWGIRLGGAFYQLSEGLFGRPKAKLSIDWQYRALPHWQLSAGYELASGITFPDLSAAPTLLSPVHVLRASASYRASNHWTLSANAQYAPSRSAQYYLGYPVQNILFNLGVNYNF